MYVTGGGLRIDYLITRDGQAMTGLIGGNAIYSAVGARLWTEEVMPWARYGDNYPPEWITTLDEIGLSPNGLVKVTGDQDHRTFYAYTTGGQRVDTKPEEHFARINHPLPLALRDYDDSTPGQDDPDYFEPLALRPTDWPENFLNTKAVHLSPLPLSSHLSLPRILRNNGVELITLDPGERYMVPERTVQLKQLLPQIDVILPSKQELLSFFGTHIKLVDACQNLVDWGAKLVIVKLGARGIAAYQQNNGRIEYYPAYHEPGEQVVDVTGAGDAFCGGFLAGLYSTGEVDQAIAQGSISASIVVEGYGALYALRQSRQTAYERLYRLKR